MFRESGFHHAEKTSLSDVLNRQMAEMVRQALWKADADRRRRKA